MAVVVVPERGAQFWSELARVGTMGAAEPWGDGGAMGCGSRVVACVWVRRSAGRNVEPAGEASGRFYPLHQECPAITCR